MGFQLIQKVGDVTWGKNIVFEEMSVRYFHFQGWAGLVFIDVGDRELVMTCMLISNLDFAGRC